MDERVDSGRSIPGVLCSVFSLLSVVLCLVPFAWHIKNRNIPACSLILWIVIFNTFTFMNSLIWPTGDVSNWWDGAVLCDIQAKLFWATYSGDAGALAAIMRNLARVMDVNRGALVPTRAQRKREVIIDVSFCFAYPIFHIATHYIVQTNRYYIFQIVGCTPSWDWSWPTIVLIHIWPSIFCIIGSYYTSKPVTYQLSVRRLLISLESSCRSAPL
jgi:pheromone a factor receptor